MKLNFILVVFYIINTKESAAYYGTQDQIELMPDNFTIFENGFGHHKILRGYVLSSFYQEFPTAILSSKCKCLGNSINF